MSHLTHQNETLDRFESASHNLLSLRTTPFQTGRFRAKRALLIERAFALTPTVSP